MSDSFSFGFGGFRLVSPAAPSREAQLEQELSFLRTRMQEIDDQALIYATLVQIRGKKAIVAAGGGQLVEARLPTGSDHVTPGMLVRVHPGTNQITSVVEEPLGFGQTWLVRDVEKDRAEVEGLGQTRLVLFHGTPPKVGDRVVLDPTSNFIVQRLDRAAAHKQLDVDTGVSWDDVGGQADAKRALVEAIEEPFTHRDTYARYGMRPVKGVLLWGPPGNGKTMLGKAAATAMAKLHGSSARTSGFQYIKGPDILNKFVGESEANIRGIFSSARAHHEQHGYPAIVFLDEADALLGKRGETRWEGMERTTVPQFLAEMDGMHDTGALVLLATNRQDTLDPAVVRDGRIDRKIEVKRPDESDACAIFERAIKSRPLQKNASAAELAAHGAKQLFAARDALYLVRMKSGFDRRMTIADIVSGAMIVGVVERATQHAIRRELGHVASDEPKGIGRRDVDAAIAASSAEQRGLNHKDELDAFLSKLVAAEVISVQRCT